ncbi:MAG: 50S ribosomal protein L21 [Oscillospiraceae bacterium]|nr:50S ribosomal protein L21 [Oscillospiraceae bacterium]
MYAIIATGGKQYKVTEGDQLFIEKLAAEENETVEIPVIAVGNDDGTLDFADGKTVTAKVLKNGKAKKVLVMTYKPKKGEKRKMGHRQPYTKVSIEKIN